MPKEQFHLHLNYSWLESETVFQTINISILKALCFQNPYLKNSAPGGLKTEQRLKSNGKILGKRTWFIWECWSTWFYFLSRKGNQLVFLALRLIMVLSSFKLNQQESFQRRCWNEFVCKCLKQPLRGNFLIWKQFTNNYISNAFWETV